MTPNNVKCKFSLLDYDFFLKGEHKKFIYEAQMTAVA